MDLVPYSSFQRSQDGLTRLVLAIAANTTRTCVFGVHACTAENHSGRTECCSGRTNSSFKIPIINLSASRHNHPRENRDASKNLTFFPPLVFSDVLNALEEHSASSRLHSTLNTVKHISV